MRLHTHPTQIHKLTKEEQLNEYQDNISKLIKESQTSESLDISNP